MMQRGSDTNVTKLWSLLLYIPLLSHFVVNAQENKKNTILSYKRQSGKYSKKNKIEEKVCVCVCVCVFVCAWILGGVWC
jgi:hypothetical protein